MPSKSDLQRVGDLCNCKDCRALQLYQVSIVAVVLQFAGMGQCRLATISIVVIMLVHLFRDSVDKAKFRLYTQCVALTRQQVADIFTILDAKRLGVIDCAC